MTSSGHAQAGEDRRYRRLGATKRLKSFHVTVQETDLWVQAENDLAAVCREEILTQRGYIENYIQRFPKFKTTLTPWHDDQPAPEIIRMMTAAGQAAGVGPMAAVAGAMAEMVGLTLRRYSQEIIVENGGDIYLALRDSVTIGLYAGQSPLSMQIGLRLNTGTEPLAVCTSSGTVGHSLSRGRADAVSVVARHCALADAVATSAANRVTTPQAIPEAIRFARTINGVQGVVVVCGEQMGLWGDIEIVKMDREKRLEF